MNFVQQKHDFLYKGAVFASDLLHTPTTVSTIQEKGSQFFLQVPLLFLFSIQTKPKLGFSLLAGVQNTFLTLVKEKGTIFHEKDPNETINNKKYQFKYHSLSAVIGLNATYNVMSKLSLSIEPNTKFTIVKGTNRQLIYAYGLAVLLTKH
ncbi:MAG: hypothetical protein RLZZ292_63 [Bacteroidota bacterium]